MQGLAHLLRCPLFKLCQISLTIFLILHLHKPLISRQLYRLFFLFLLAAFCFLIIQLSALSLQINLSEQKLPEFVHKELFGIYIIELLDEKYKLVFRLFAQVQSS